MTEHNNFTLQDYIKRDDNPFIVSKLTVDLGGIVLKVNEILLVMQTESFYFVLFDQRMEEMTIERIYLFFFDHSFKCRQ